MPNLKISELTPAGALSGTELVELVQGGVNVKSTVQDIANLGGGGTSIGGSVTGGTNGSVLFIGSGALAEDNANFFYDDTNKRFGLGTESPLARQHIVVNAIGASPTLASGLLLDNQTPVTGAGAVQYAPVIIQRGRARKTNATAVEQTVDFRGMLVPADGAAAVTGTYQWGFSIAGGAFNTAATLTSTGQLSATALVANGAISSGATFTSANLWVNSASTGTQTNASGLYFGTSGNISLRTAFNGTTNYSVPASNNYGAVIVGAMAATEAASGTHPILANMIIRPPAFTNGAAASTDIVTLYIEGAPTGTATSTNGNTALLIGSGNSRTNGMFSIGGGGGVAYNSWLTLGGSNGAIGVVTFTSGSYTTTPTRHTMDYDGTLWGWTNSDSVRRKMATWVINTTPVLAGAVPVPTDYYGASGTRILGEPDGWFETLHPDTGAAVAVPYYNVG